MITYGHKYINRLEGFCSFTEKQNQKKKKGAILNVVSETEEH